MRDFDSAVEISRVRHLEALSGQPCQSHTTFDARALLVERAAVCCKLQLCFNHTYLRSLL